MIGIALFSLAFLSTTLWLSENVSHYLHFKWYHASSLSVTVSSSLLIWVWLFGTSINTFVRQSLREGIHRVAHSWEHKKWHKYLCSKWKKQAEDGSTFSPPHRWPVMVGVNVGPLVSALQKQLTKIAPIQCWKRRKVFPKLSKHLICSSEGVKI